MKRILWLLLAVISCTTAIAQTDFISDSRYEDADRFGNLDGQAGILILSAHNDIVITIINVPSGAKSPIVTPKGKGSLGFFEYEVVFDKKIIPEPKVEVHRRGDVRRTTFVVRPKADLFVAYLIEEVSKKIGHESLQAANDAVLDELHAAIELTSSVEGLKVNVSPLLQAEMKSERHKTDNNITIFTIKIPVAVFNEADAKYDAAKTAYETDAMAYQKAEKEHEEGKLKPEKLLEYMDKHDKSEEVLEKIISERKERSSIILYAEGSNKLVIDIGERLAPRQKLCYGIMPLEKPVHVSKCSGFLSEGGRLFNLRKYKDARQAFTQALTANDAPKDMISAIKSNIAQCDTCLEYEKYAMFSLTKMKEARNSGSINQEEVVKYSTAALEFIEVLNKYNPCDFYNTRINQLNEMIKDLPLALRFNIVKWVNGYSGFTEGGPFSNVEVWAYYGSGIPEKNSYKNERKFKKLTESYEYRLQGISDSKGCLELDLKRSELPTGFMFHAIGYKDKCDIVYFDADDIISKAKGTYNKRQFRIRLSIKEESLLSR